MVNSGRRRQSIDEDDDDEDVKSEQNNYDRDDDDDDDEDDDDMLVTSVKVETVMVDPSDALTDVVDEPPAIKIETTLSIAADVECVVDDVETPTKPAHRSRSRPAHTTSSVLDEEFLSNDIYFGDGKSEKKRTPPKTPTKSPKSPKIKIKREPKSLTDRLYPCEQCGKFFDVNKMECHLNTHRGNRRLT